MNYKYYTIVILGLLAFSACEKDDIDIPATDNEVNQWIEQTMRENYLWYSEFPDKSSLDFSLDPETFFKGLLSDKDGKDLPEGHHYFSQLEKATVTKSIYDANNSYGFDFATSNLKDGGSTYKIAIVLYVLKDSPAEEAGLKRGDWILGVNGSLGSIQDYDVLRSGGSVSLQLGKEIGNTKGFVSTRRVTLNASRTVEGIYLMKDMTVEVVADGIHVPPAILKLVYQIKGVERTSLITDAMAAAACDNGTEHFPDSRVIIEEGVCKLADRSAIAGSIATGIRLIRTLVEKAEIPLHDAVRMASESPARLMGILDRKGTLEKGKDADIIIFNNDIEIQETFIEGKRLSKE